MQLAIRLYSSSSFLAQTFHRIRCANSPAIKSQEATIAIVVSHILVLNVTAAWSSRPLQLAEANELSDFDPFNCQVEICGL